MKPSIDEAKKRLRELDEIELNVLGDYNHDLHDLQTSFKRRIEDIKFERAELNNIIKTENRETGA
jgi:hypothetical protein